jgi:hypothetical protein
MEPNILHYYAISAHMQERMDVAANSRQVREVRRSQPRQPRLRWVRLRRHAVVEGVPSATVTAIPPV